MNYVHMLIWISAKLYLKNINEYLIKKLILFSWKWQKSWERNGKCYGMFEDNVEHFLVYFDN